MTMNEIPTSLPVQLDEDIKYIEEETGYMEFNGGPGDLEWTAEACEGDAAMIKIEAKLHSIADIQALREQLDRAEQLMAQLLTVQG